MYTSSELPPQMSVSIVLSVKFCDVTANDVQSAERLQLQLIWQLDITGQTV